MTSHYTRLLSLSTFLSCFGLFSGTAQETIELEAREVFAEKLPIGSTYDLSRSVFFEEVEFLSVNDISETIDDYPGYSAYRRTSARAAHPTTQGVRIRNLGANATSRALVTLDGLPLNDPFGAWVYWHRINPQDLRAVSIETSGSRQTWGNFGSGGSISLISKNQRRTGGRFTVGVGTEDTYQASLAHSLMIDDQIALDLSGRVFETEGFETVLPSQKGAIDQAAGSEAKSGRARLRFGLDTPWSLTFVADAFSEERNNGTPLGLNETDALDFSIQFTRELEGADKYWNFSVYEQSRDFANVFTSARDNRSWERPALDQFDVPTDARGAGFNFFAGSEADFILAGIDFREADAQVFELFRNLGGGFERQRTAGGDQSFTGLFLNGGRRLNDSDTITATLRLDRIEQKNGFRNEFDLADGNVRRDDTYSSQSNSELSGSIAYTRSFNEQSEGSLKLFSGFRSPTLNELYRPFRVVNDITEANSNLENERHSGVEAAFRIEDQNGLEINGSVFHYRIDNMIANVLLSTETGFNALCGFVPGGGSCNQRFNIEESEVTGGEFSIRQRFTEALSGRIQYVYTDTNITESSVSPVLQGNEFAHASPHRLNASIDWSGDNGFEYWAMASLWDDEFEDVENSRRIDGEVLFDLGLRYETDPNSRITLKIENVLDTTIQTGISTGGLFRIGAPRSATLSFSRLY